MRINSSLEHLKLVGETDFSLYIYLYIYIYIYLRKRIDKKWEDYKKQINFYEEFSKCKEMFFYVPWRKYRKLKFPKDTNSKKQKIKKY